MVFLITLPNILFFLPFLAFYLSPDCMLHTLHTHSHIHTHIGSQISRINKWRRRQVFLNSSLSVSSATACQSFTWKYSNWANIAVDSNIYSPNKKWSSRGQGPMFRENNLHRASEGWLVSKDKVMITLALFVSFAVNIIIIITSIQCAHYILLWAANT